MKKALGELLGRCVRTFVSMIRTLQIPPTSRVKERNGGVIRGRCVRTFVLMIRTGNWNEGEL